MTKPLETTEAQETNEKVNGLLELIETLANGNGDASQANVCQFLLNYAKLNHIGKYS